MRIPLTCLFLALAAAPGVSADCVMPTATVEVPDGATATIEEMRAAQTATRGHLDKLQAYLDCIDAENARLGKSEADNELRALNVTRYNAAVEAMELTAARFNEQRLRYNAAQTDD